MKIIILLISLNLLVFASLSKVEEYYKAGSYDKAIQEAKDSKEDYSNPKLHLLWAKSAEALGKTDVAMSAYERVLMYDEDSVESRVALAKIYDSTERYDLAATMKESLKKYELEKEQESAIEELKGESPHKLNASASLHFGYDTNINASPDAEIIDDYYNITGSTGQLSTMFSKFIGSAGYVNEFGGKGGWYAKADLRANHQQNFSETFYNMSVGSAEAGIGYRGEKFNLYLPYSYNAIYYIEKYLFNQQKINPRLTFFISESSIFNMNLTYAKREHVQASDKTRDDVTMGAGGGLYFLFGKDYIYLSGKYENFSAVEDNPAKYVDKNMLSASVGFSYDLFSLVTSKVDYRLRAGIYDTNPFLALDPDSTVRTDIYQQVEVKFSHSYSKKLEAYVSNKYIQNISNYVPAEHTKNIVMLGLGVKY